MKRKKKYRKRRRAVSILALCLCAAVLVFGYMKIGKERTAGSEKNSESEENELSEAGNTQNVQAEIRENPDQISANVQQNQASGDEDGQASEGEDGQPGEQDSKEEGRGIYDALGQEDGAPGTASSKSGSAKDTREKYTGDISALDNTSQGWGQGVQFDELNRPAGATSYQEKYGKYSADFIRMEEGDTKRIYLTFDEGYENGYTSKILDVLKEKNCPAVFFVTLPYVREEPELIQRMIDEGHIVGNHSVTHPSAGLPSQTREQQENELLELHQYVKENFGYEMSLFRYPAGKFSEQSLAIVQSVDYTSVFWSFAYADWDPSNQPEETKALVKLKERLHPGAIYLLHAVSKTNTDILGQFIDDARAAGYEFVPYR